MVDPIADLLTRIRNAGLARHASTRVPFSRTKERILEILKEEGYVDSFEVDKVDDVRTDMVVHLRYLDDTRIAINTIRRVSTPGRRVYAGAKDIPTVKNGLGTSIVSTSKGIMTDRDARKQNVGGEIMVEIW